VEGWRLIKSLLSFSGDILASLVIPGNKNSVRAYNAKAAKRKILL
jgi:hypothetical protein